MDIYKKGNPNWMMKYQQGPDEERMEDGENIETATEGKL